MARQTFDINFYCRKSKADKNGFAPVELSIVINGERCYLRLQRKERPEDFKRAMESKRANDLKGFIENERILINRIVEDMSFADVELTAENLKECLKKGGVANFYSLGQLWNDVLHNKKAELSTGDLAMETMRKYLLAKDAFYKANQVDDKTPAKEMTVQNIINLQSYLRSQGMKQNTIYQYHAKCKAAFTLAFESGKIKRNPYAPYRMDKGEKKEIIWLTDDEMKRIKEKEISIERLGNVRDLFVFQCNSGLAYADLATITKKDFQHNEMNQTFIEKDRMKTGERYVSIILNDGLEILERYDYTLPILSNQKYNSYLKEIQDLCGIEKTMTSHLARRTYVCFLYNRHLPPETIAAMVGHYTVQTTLKYYAKMDKRTIFDDVRKYGVANETKPGKQRSKLSPDAKATLKAAKSAKTAAILEDIKTKGVSMTEDAD